MIQMNAKALDAEIQAGIKRLSDTITKDKAFARSQANSLAAGAKAIAAKAKTMAPKGGKSRKGQAKVYGQSGLLKKSIKVKSGVTKKGAPFAVVGPSRAIEASVRRGKKTAMQKPSNYAHLVEFGFTAHARVPLVSGRTHGTIAKKGVVWMGSELQKYIDKNRIDKASLSKGKLTRTTRFMGASQKTTRVPGQHFIDRAWSASRGSIAALIIERLAIETQKAIAKNAKASAA